MTKLTQPSPGSSTPRSFEGEAPAERSPNERSTLLNKQRSIDLALQSEFITSHGSYGSDGGDSNDRRDAGEWRQVGSQGSDGRC